MGVTTARELACEVADRANLTQQAQWLDSYRQRLGRMPMHGGHKFVLATWTSGIVRPTVENFERYWTPGPASANDPHYHELRLTVLRGEDPWPDITAAVSRDTGYAGRAEQHLVTIGRLHDQALMVNDNETGWSLSDGTVNVLFDSGKVRTYSYPLLREIYGLGPFDPAVVVPTTGDESPIVPCRKLAR